MTHVHDKIIKSMNQSMTAFSLVVETINTIATWCTVLCLMNMCSQSRSAQCNELNVAHMYLRSKTC